MVFRLREIFIEKMMNQPIEEPWISHNGCNTCINSDVCEKLGNCVLLSIDLKYPENNKAKRKLIQKIRTAPVASRHLFAEEFTMREKKLISNEADKPIIRLTLIEKMFIENFNKRPKPVNNDD